MQAADLTTGLMDPEAAFTILAPTDSALDVISAAEFEGLLANAGALDTVRLPAQYLVLKAEGDCPASVAFPVLVGTCILPHCVGHTHFHLVDISGVQIMNLHIIPGALTAADLATMTEVTTAGGMVLSIASEDGSVSFTGPSGGSLAVVTEADIESCAGVVHKLDALLVPGVPTL